MDLLILSSILMLVITISLTGVLLGRRVFLASKDRKRLASEQRLQATALAIMDGEQPDITAEDALVVARILHRYGARVSGNARQAITEFFERHSTVDRSIRDITHRRPWRRATAAFLLGVMSSPHGIDALIGALQDPDPEVRSAAVASLGKLQDDRAIDPLIRTLMHHRASDILVLSALLRIGPTIIPSLSLLLYHDDPALRRHGVDLLGFLGGTVEVLLPFVTDTSAEVRAGACRAIARVGERRAADSVRGALGDRIPFVRTAAAWALGELRDQDARDGLLFQAIHDTHDPARAAARALMHVDKDAVRDHAHASPWLQEAADRLEARI